MPLRPSFVVLGWKIWAHFCGMGVVALGVGFAIVQAVSGNAAVITASDVRRLDGEPLSGPPMRIKAGTRYGYVYDLERHESCPGEVVITWTSADAGAPAVVSVRKPSVLSAVRFYENVQIDNPLPESVRLGLWTMRTVMVSRCPNREQTDPISEFAIEVTS